MASEDRSATLIKADNLRLPTKSALPPSHALLQWMGSFGSPFLLKVCGKARNSQTVTSADPVIAARAPRAKHTRRAPVVTAAFAKLLDDSVVPIRGSFEQPFAESNAS